MRPQPVLQAGDRIGVVSPGFAVRPAALRAGIAALTALGFEVTVAPHASGRSGYFAASDRDRAADFDRFVADRAIRAIWCARGDHPRSANHFRNGAGRMAAALSAARRSCCVTLQT